ncbi:MAG: tetratricopeptide repeat protein, partial [Deltaproteobacteria bacterium]|nr:tetratricopeptide repeat protein [Deltaproteobacteria bacterium]
MSSIHDALRRARRMNEASGQVLNPPQADLPLKKPRSRAPFLSMIVILAVAAGAAAWLVLRPGETEAPLAEKSQTLAKAETAGAVAPASAKASPAAKSLLKPSESEKAAPAKKLLKAAAPQTSPLKARPTPGVIKKKAAARARTQLAETAPRRDEPGLKARTKASLPQAVRVAARPVRDPEAAVKHFDLGRAAQAKGRYSEAVSEYRQALRLNPNLAQAYLNLGNIFFFHDKTLDKAKEMYTRVLKIDPDSKLGH